MIEILKKYGFKQADSSNEFVLNNYRATFFKSGGISIAKFSKLGEFLYSHTIYNEKELNEFLEKLFGKI